MNMSKIMVHKNAHSFEAVLTDCGMENIKRTYFLMMARARIKYDRAATAASFTSEFKDLLDAAKVAKNEQLCYIRQRLTTGCDSPFNLFVLLRYLDISLGFKRHQSGFDVVFSIPGVYHLTIRTEIDVA
ncbi:hypothetical protein PAEPH01_1581 [Pancytospora epiphaga]|nr:hypothetical protein PAEPH01_1581 [Pancytospora epiphaga]